MTPGAHALARRNAVQPTERDRLYIPLFLLLLTALVQTACAGVARPTSEGTGPLPGPPPGPVAFSKYEPANPYVQLAQGLLTRTVFQARDGTGLIVEVHDLLVGPRQRTHRASLPGAAVFEIRSGVGAVTANGERREVHAGSTFVIPERAAFAIENAGDDQVAVRVHIFRAE
jgi:quercetin dioxygenase-like cupin family protein